MNYPEYIKDFADLLDNIKRIKDVAAESRLARFKLKGHELKLAIQWARERFENSRIDDMIYTENSEYLSISSQYGTKRFLSLAFDFSLPSREEEKYGAGIQFNNFRDGYPPDIAIPNIDSLSNVEVDGLLYAFGYTVDIIIERINQRMFNSYKTQLIRILFEEEDPMEANKEIFDYILKKFPNLLEILKREWPEETNKYLDMLLK